MCPISTSSTIGTSSMPSASATASCWLMSSCPGARVRPIRIALALLEPARQAQPVQGPADRRTSRGRRPRGRPGARPRRAHARTPARRRTACPRARLMISVQPPTRRPETSRSPPPSTVQPPVRVQGHPGDRRVALVVVPAQVAVAARAALGERRRSPRRRRSSAAGPRDSRTACPSGSSRAGSPSPAAARPGASTAVVSLKPTVQVGSACASSVPVEPVEQVDGELASPRRDDRADRRVDQHRGQLGGALLLRRGDDPVAAHALADHDVVPTLGGWCRGRRPAGPAAAGRPRWRAR